MKKSSVAETEVILHDDDDDLRFSDERSQSEFEVESRGGKTIIEVSRLLTSELQRLPVQHKCC